VPGCKKSGVCDSEDVELIVPTKAAADKIAAKSYSIVLNDVHILASPKYTFEDQGNYTLALGLSTTDSSRLRELTRNGVKIGTVQELAKQLKQAIGDPDILFRRLGFPDVVGELEEKPSVLPHNHPRLFGVP
jgi:hypothetical protein